VRRALAPLLERRRKQAGDRYLEMEYRPGERKRLFLKRYGAGGANPVEPGFVPYYLLLVGDPEAIPFGFQYQLDVQYAVGRLCLEDEDAYGAYAHAALAAEDRSTGPATRLPGGRRLILFAVENPDDRATGLSARHLVPPLYDRLRQDFDGWRIDKITGDDASKARLGDLLGGPETPDLLFTASHGIGFGNGSARQRGDQGALVCADWPGPERWPRAVPAEHYFASRDLPPEADLGGLISFHFACYGAGTPRVDAFSHRRPGRPAEIAPRPFVARLPQRLLRHGALATIGHVERAWGCSFLWGGAGGRPQAFEATLKLLMQGWRVGAATELLNQRHAELAVDFVEFLEEIRERPPAVPERRLPRGMTAEEDHRQATAEPLPVEYSKAEKDEIGRLWTARNDARSWIVLGDPAVRLPGLREIEESDREETI
jgi:hypothetical protein